MLVLMDQELTLNCSHVPSTGVIKGLVITEEGGIAKGIRRIIAVTAEDAQEVTRAADALAARISHARSLSGSEKEAAIKVLSTVCNGNRIASYNQVLITYL